MMTRLWRVLSDIRGPKDLLIYSKDEVSRWSDTSNHALHGSFERGKCLGCSRAWKPLRRPLVRPRPNKKSRQP